MSKELTKTPASEEVAEKPSTLSLSLLSDFPEKKGHAFKLITDAQAQRQNLFNNALLFHWITTSSYALVVSLAITAYYTKYRDMGVLVLALAGISISFLSLVSRFSEDQVKLAEAMQFDDYIGTESDIKKNLFKSAAYVYNNAVVAVITASVDKQGDWTILGWSVLRKYRRTGLGVDTLEWLIQSISKKNEKKSKVTRIKTSTISVDVPAEALLAKKGFKKVKTAPIKGLRGSLFGLTENDWVLEL